MNHARRFIFIGFVLLGSLFSTSGLTAAEEERHEGIESIASILPEDIYFLIRIPSLKNAWEGFQSLPLYKAYQDEEVKTFIESFGDGITELTPGLRPEQIADLLSLPDVFDGEAVFALIPRGTDEVDWVFSMACLEDTEKATRYIEKTLHPFLKSLLSWGPVQEEMESTQVMRFFGPEHALFSANLDGRLVIADRREVMQKLLSRARDEKRPPSSHEILANTVKRAGAKDVSFMFYFNLESLLNIGEPEMSKRELAELEASGIDGLRSILAALRMSDGRANEVVRLDIPEEKRGFLRIFADSFVDADLARIAPDHTLCLAAGHFQIAELYRTILAMENASPGGPLEDWQTSADELAVEVGLRSFSDLISQFGTEMILFAALPRGGGLLPEAVGAIEVLEPDKLQTNLFGLIETMTGRKPSTVTYRNRQIHYFPSEGGSRFFDVSVCWCLTDGYLFLSLHPSVLKGLVRRLDQGTRTLKDDPDFSEAWKKLPENAVAVAYVNSERIFNYLYGLIMPIAAMTGGDLPFDPAMMPTAEAISSHLSFGLSGVVKQEDGIIIKTESDGYGPTSILLYGLTAAAFVIPFETWGNSINEWPSCGYTQQSIYEALEAYRQNNQAYPEELSEELREVTGIWVDDGCNVERQGLTRNELDERKPFQDFEYVISAMKIEPPETFPLDWMIVWDSEPRHNNGRIILLGSGDVIWLPEEEFQKRFEEQGK
ncbi:MAG: hypothetical protein ACYTG7_08400 [Planctomycetota bacterium]